MKALPLAVVMLIPLSSWAGDDMQLIQGFTIDRTEVTIGQVRAYQEATGFVSRAERTGGGLVYAAGWEQKPGWTWKTPYGQPAGDDEPAVHLDFDEAAAYCAWAGKRLPTDREWTLAAYTETRKKPAPPFKRGVTYPYPTGESPLGANCLNDCGPTPAVDYSQALERGTGHAPTGSTRIGVNGLFDMGANVWEWTDDGGSAEKGTRGGSWWYGADRMRAADVATKPRHMSVVYIGFRCVRELP